MSYTNRIAWEPLRTIDSATLTGGYDAVGGPLEHQSYIFKMINNADVLVTVSIDGIEDVDVLPGNSFFLYDESEGNQAQPALPAGTQIYVKGTAGTGIIYVVTQYLIVN